MMISIAKSDDCFIFTGTLRKIIKTLNFAIIDESQMPTLVRRIALKKIFSIASTSLIISLAERCLLLVFVFNFVNHSRNLLISVWAEPVQTKKNTVWGLSETRLS